MKKTNTTQRDLFFRVFSFLRPYWKELLFTFFIILLFSAANVYFIPLVRDIAKEITNKRSYFFSMQILNAMILWFIRVITQFGQTYMMSKISNQIRIDIQQNIYEKLHSFSQHFYSKWKLGDLLTRTFSDSGKVCDMILQTFSNLIPQALTLVAVLIYLFTMSWKLTLFAMIAVPIFVFIMTYFSELLKRLASQMQKKAANITHLVQESLVNMKLVQAYTMEKESTQKLYRENRKNYKINMTSIRLNETKKMIELFLQGIIFISIIFIGGRLVAQNQMTGPELLSFFTGCALLIDPVVAFSSGFTAIQQSMVSAERLYKILDHPILIQNPSNGQSTEITGNISLNNIAFRYSPEGPDVLNNVTIHAKQGNTIALVGLSGAGKSTLINLIPRFYDPTQGEISIDDIKIKDYDLHALRSQIGMVLQDDILFSGTILENIRFGSPKSTIAQITNAAKKANAWSFIETFPDKLYTQVGDHGKRLSGGQKQRISIARAFLRNPKILILDEATSALDSESEQFVKKALIELMKGRTTFVIAHRLSTIKHATNIIVLDQGAIIEEGTHDTLIQKKGKYSHLYNLQFH